MLILPRILLGNHPQDGGQAGKTNESGMETQERREGILDPRELIHVTPAIDQNLRRGDGSIHDRLPSIKRIERQPGKQERAARRDRPTDQPGVPFLLAASGDEPRSPVIPQQGGEVDRNSP